MKRPALALAGMAFVLAMTFSSHAQETTAPLQSFQSLSVEDMAVMLEAIESVPPIPFDATSRQQSVGTFWSAQHPPGSRAAWPPLPCNFWGRPLWPLGNGQFIYDDRNVDYQAIGAAADAEAALTAALSPRMSGMMLMSLASSYSYGNPVYLINLVISSAGYQPMTASFSIAGGTNYVPYDILMTTNLLNKVSDWNWLGIGYTSNNYTFASQPADMAFYILAKPSKTMTVGFGNDDAAQCDVPFGLTNALQVAGGGGQSLALKTDGTVVAWGQNYYGQATVPTNLVGVAMISAGWYHSVALLTNGTVTAWGLNIPALGYPLTAVPSNLTNATVISAQALHTLALRKDGTVVAWGYNTSFGETNVPAGLSNVVAISAGYQHNLAVKSDGTVIAWGANDLGQCNVPADLSNVVDVAAGLYHSLALLNNGTVVAWGDNGDGETNVPAGLSNIVAIAASGDPSLDTAYSLALKSDGTVIAWGDDEAVDPVGGLNDVIAITAGSDHALAVRTGPATPVITLEPIDAYQVQGSNATFTARGAGLYGVTYQWQTNGVNLSGATQAALTLTNVQAAQLVSYRVVVDNEKGSIVSSNANLYFVTPPVIVSKTMPTNQVAIYQSNLVLNVVATALGIYNGFPLSYQWQFNGSNISGANAASYTIHANANSFGTYSVHVSNAAGSTNAAWQVTVYYPGLLISQQPTNQYQIAGGDVTFVGSGVASNTVTYQWAFDGTNIAGATNPSLTLTNVQEAQQGCYNFTVSDGVGSLTSSNAYFYLVTPPTITSQTLPTNMIVVFQTNVTLNVVASAPAQTNGFPIRYQWQFNGTNIAAATSSNYSFAVSESGTYSVLVSNVAGGASTTWQVTMTYEGSIFANIMTRTNGRSGFIWSGFVYGQTNATGFTWLTNGFLTGLHGASAISPANELGGSQVPGTALTRRHVYIRGHDAGGVPNMVSTNLGFIGKKYWFIGTNNIAVSATIADNRVCDPSNGEDWTILFLSSDLPAEVEPMRCIMDGTRTATNAATPGNIWNMLPPSPPWPIFGTCQHNQLSGSDWGYSIFNNHNVHDYGDSGSPNMLLLTNEVVFLSGRTTSGITSLMMSNINAMTLSAGLSTNSYQPQFVNLNGWPNL